MNQPMNKPIRIIIMGAAGRDFHNFNMYFRDNPIYRVVCFTATQIEGIANRTYPKVLAGKLYPHGIPIYEQSELISLVKQYGVDQVVLAYSDLSHNDVMQIASVVLSTGADFKLLGPKYTMLKSNKKVISVCAVRTGCGKSSVTRYVCDFLRKKGIRFVVVRHPMPYGILSEQIWERFETREDLVKYKATIEEREEYEPHIERHEIVYAGVDYAEILRRAEKEADVIVWDGGNNDFPFFKPDLNIVLVDPLRPGHELTYYPGETNLLMADVVIINKEKTAHKKDIDLVYNNVKMANPRAIVVDGSSEINVREPELVRNKRVLVIEDGPTLTHGGMSYGAGSIAAKRLNATMVDPRKYAVGSIKKIYEKFEHLSHVLPAMGYSPKQLAELKATINATPADSVIIGTPIRLDRIIEMNKPAVRIDYEFEELGTKLYKILGEFVKGVH